MENTTTLIVNPTIEITPKSIGNLLNTIRPVWKSRDLIKRVERLLPVDPSSACQRLLNAAIYDLREKIINVGCDIAKEVAKLYKLPPIEKDDDIIEYSVSNIIDLSYRIGLLTRPEWRRIQRCYEIRRDLEHEDNEYEAVLEDCFYIFKSSIEVVLAQDPKDLLKVIDVKQIATEPVRISVTEELLQNYEHAPALRQEEISAFLLSIACDEKQPDIVRENSVELLRHFKTTTHTTVIIESARNLEERLGKKPLDFLTAKLGHACGATAYFKKAKIKDFYLLLFKDLQEAKSDWGDQASAVKTFHDIGAFAYCPAELIPEFTKYLTAYYIGQPGGYGSWGRNRKVFYSNSAAPVIAKVVKHSEVDLYEIIDGLRSDDNIKSLLADKYIFARFESLLDLVTKGAEG